MRAGTNAHPSSRSDFRSLQRHLRVMINICHLKLNECPYNGVENIFHLDVAADIQLDSFDIR